MGVTTTSARWEGSTTLLEYGTMAVGLSTARWLLSRYTNFLTTSHWSKVM
jgi:hypothetical protein